MELSPLDRALRAARRGHDVAAQRLLDDVLAVDPQNEEAVLWRARVADEPAARAHFLRRALDLNPDNRWAADQLADLGDPSTGSGQVVDATAAAPAASAAAPPARTERIERLQCPNCGGQVEIHADRGVKAAVCVHCGSVLDLTAAQAAVIGSTKPSRRPKVPVEPGMEGTFEGENHLVIGWLRYKGWDDESKWYWDEWQLVSDTGRVRYLSYSDDEGFLLQTPVHPTPKVTKRGIELASGRIGFSETSPAKIEAVRGELTWRPKLGETLKVGEADHGGTAYSVELTADEVEVVAGPTLTDAEVWTAFGRDDLVEKDHQAKARMHRYAQLARPCWVAFLGFLLVAMVASCTGREVVDESLTLPVGQAAEVGAFEADAGDVVKVDVRADLQASNTWTAPDVYVTGPAGTRRYLFTPDLWTWASGGESESNRSASRMFAAPASGTYQVDVELAESDVSTAELRVRVETGLWLARYFVIAAGLSLLLGIVVRAAGGSGRQSY